MTMQAWPALELASWAPTKRSLHLYAQMLGKLRLALAPHQPNFLFTSLALTPLGFTTGMMPYGLGAVEAAVDVLARRMIITTSDGRERSISLEPPCTVARVFAEFHRELAAAGIAVRLSPIPQEIPDTTPLDTDDRPADFDPAAARRWHAVMTATNSVFDAWRAHFFGRTGIQLWWGAFDFTLLLFSGKKIAPPADRGYLLRYDLDAEMMNAGFYPGDAEHAAYFYGYIYPPPPACGTLAIAPAGAAWSDALGEWVLPYETLRTSDDPVATLTAFLDAIYDICGSTAGWDRAAHSYVPPPLRRAKDLREK